MILSGIEYIYIITYQKESMYSKIDKKKKKITDSFTCFYFSVYVMVLFTVY